MNKTRQNKGITLVALVITIVILSIASLTGNGLFERAKLAEEKYEQAKKDENEILGEYDSLISGSNRNNKKYDAQIHDEWTTWLNLAGITNPEHYNDTNIVENETLMNKLLSSDNAIDYMLKSKYFIMPAICSSEKAMEYIVQNTNIRRTVITDSLWKEKIIQNGFINKFDEIATKIPTSSNISQNMICSSTNSYCSVSSAFDGFFPTSNWSDSYVWIPTQSEEDSYIGYNFNEDVTLYKISLTACCYENPPRNYSFIVQGLNSDGTWEDIGNEYITNVKSRVFETYDYYINCNKTYCGYRIKNNYSISSNGDIYWHKLNTNAFGIGELQFYCIK